MNYAGLNSELKLRQKKEFEFVVNVLWRKWLLKLEFAKRFYFAYLAKMCSIPVRWWLSHLIRSFQCSFSCVLLYLPSVRDIIGESVLIGILSCIKTEDCHVEVPTIFWRRIDSVSTFGQSTVCNMFLLFSIVNFERRAIRPLIFIESFKKRIFSYILMFRDFDSV